MQSQETPDGMQYELTGGATTPEEVQRRLTGVAIGHAVQSAGSDVLHASPEARQPLSQQERVEKVSQLLTWYRKDGASDVDFALIGELKRQAEQDMFDLAV